jgi:hypothetical protein
MIGDVGQRPAVLDGDGRRWLWLVALICVTVDGGCLAVALYKMVQNQVDPLQFFSLYLTYVAVLYWML